MLKYWSVLECVGVVLECAGCVLDACWVCAGSVLDVCRIIVECARYMRKTVAV